MAGEPRAISAITLGKSSGIGPSPIWRGESKASTSRSKCWPFDVSPASSSVEKLVLVNLLRMQPLVGNGGVVVTELVEKDRPRPIPPVRLPIGLLVPPQPQLLDQGGNLGLQFVFKNRLTLSRQAVPPQDRRGRQESATDRAT